MSFLEYYFLDLEFRKIFFENFYYKNRILASTEIRALSKNGLFAKKQSDIFDQVKPSTESVFYDFEIYVRK